MPKTLFTNVRILDGMGQSATPGEILVKRNGIQSVSKGRKKLPHEGASVVNGGRATLMPRLVSSNCQMSYTGPESMGDLPVEEHMPLTMRQAKTIIAHGFTAAISAGAAA